MKKVNVKLIQELEKAQMKPRTWADVHTTATIVADAAAYERTKDSDAVEGTVTGALLNWQGDTATVRVTADDGTATDVTGKLVGKPDGMTQPPNFLPRFRTGDSLRMHLKVREGARERIQLFEGVVIRHQGGQLNERCTLRRVTHGVGVERIFLVHSPRIEKIEVIRLGKVRRARLYYLRSRIGARATRIKERARI